LPDSIPLSVIVTAWPSARKPGSDWVRHLLCLQGNRIHLLGKNPGKAAVKKSLAEQWPIPLERTVESGNFGSRTGRATPNSDRRQAVRRR